MNHPVHIIYVQMRALESLALHSSRASNLNDSDIKARSCIAHCVSVRERNGEMTSLTDGTPISRIAVESTDMADSPLLSLTHWYSIVATHPGYGGNMLCMLFGGYCHAIFAIEPAPICDCCWWNDCCCCCFFCGNASPSDIPWNIKNIRRARRWPPPPPYSWCVAGRNFSRRRRVTASRAAGVRVLRISDIKRKERREKRNQ